MRSRWKNSYVSRGVYTRIAFGSNEDSGDRLHGSIRASTILPFMRGSVFTVHDGRTLRIVTVSARMFGHKLGEFAHTKALCVYRRKKKKKDNRKKRKKVAKKK